MSKRVRNEGRHHETVVTADVSGHGARVDEETFRVTHGATRGGTRTLFVNDRVVRVQLGEAVYLDGRRVEVGFERDSVELGSSARRTRVNDGILKSPMPGRVLRVSVAAGDLVSVTTEVVVVEAMKMENQLFAPCAGRVETVWVTTGQTVEAQADLLRVVPE
jgi:biotin carboxyl carrier protein